MGVSIRIDLRLSHCHGNQTKPVRHKPIHRVRIHCSDRNPFRITSIASVSPIAAVASGVSAVLCVGLLTISAVSTISPYLLCPFTPFLNPLDVYGCRCWTDVGQHCRSLVQWCRWATLWRLYSAGDRQRNARFSIGSKALIGVRWLHCAVQKWANLPRGLLTLAMRSCPPLYGQCHTGSPIHLFDGRSASCAVDRYANCRVVVWRLVRRSVLARSVSRSIVLRQAVD